ncbi:hypothetical protein MPLSOD_270016 [Mesorhizobium sp. SOD10]|jgi:hypothetical protein|nr:hypothetical protein MPLSOD_270016 [Mesorhizobium sp. SOD10]
MKRTYEKPTLVKRDRLSAVTAVVVVSIVNGSAT